MTEPIEVKMYLHSQKEYCREIAEKIGLGREQSDTFRWALSEVEFILLVDPDTGHYAIKEVRDT